MSSTDASLLKRYIQGLPQIDRYILLLHYADELTTTEIGLVLNLAEQRVAQRLEQLRLSASAIIDAHTDIGSGIRHLVAV